MTFRKFSLLTVSAAVAAVAAFSPLQAHGAKPRPEAAAAAPSVAGTLPCEPTCCDDPIACCGG